MNLRNTRILLIAILLIMLVIAVGYFIIDRNKQQSQNNEQVTSNQGNSESGQWKTYTTGKLSLEYPSGWTIEEFSQTETGRVAGLRSPETQTSLRNNQVNPGYSYDLVISYWPSINNLYARGGAWSGMREYKNLEDHFTDTGAFKKKTGMIMIDGRTAFEVGIGGAGINYGVMVEHGGIYELSFETAWDKSGLTEAQKQLLTTVKFSN